MLNGIFTIGQQTRVWLSLSLLALAGGLGGTRAEEGREMIYIEFRPVSPNIKPGSFEASVRKLWRSGDRYLRIEEALDPQRRIHGVIIVNEPDSWMWNRSDNTALHILDRRPPSSRIIRYFKERTLYKLWNSAKRRNFLRRIAALHCLIKQSTIPNTR